MRAIRKLQSVWVQLTGVSVSTIWANLFIAIAAFGSPLFTMLNEAWSQPPCTHISIPCKQYPCTSAFGTACLQLPTSVAVTYRPAWAGETADCVPPPWPRSQCGVIWRCAFGGPVWATGKPCGGYIPDFDCL